ncbi:MAG: ABC transporter substrate-binding protein [Richelia sp. RM2_1_2]|nr:ABC transporter substrate-binding protein [Richelia sp. SM1_7_0]NJN11435.1 ABC transporter substrate-binding protein [Richelia sp. RM1_1_1]NJO64072.1 ABC transporter substrate-binding protein [Richelia sp. RM2_1_2]
MRIYCTNPQCKNPEREFNETEFKQTFLDDNSRKQRFCECCGMPLILEMRYLPLRKIGGGGFGKVFYARDLNFSNGYRAVKLLHPQQRLERSQLQSVINKFKQGADTLNELAHPQIPNIYSYFNLPTPDQQKTLFYLVQEYIPGETLAEELNNRGKYPENEVHDILKSLLEIISYTHKEGVLHRDIKPANIIRHDQNKKLYLIDFDTAIKRELELGVPVAQSLVMGTPGYAPPEQLAGRTIDASADLYAIAATCVNLLTARDLGEIIQISPSSQLRRTWREYAPNVSPDLANILDKMLSHDTRERYQSAQEVLDVLDDKQKRNPLEYLKRKILKLLKSKRWIVFPVLAVLTAIMVFAIPDLGSRIIAIFVSPPPPAPCSEYSCDIGDGFSWGEDILIETKTSPEKQAGTKAFIGGKYELAIENFKTHLANNPNDPEALIYLNNAIAALTNNPIKIAASIPIDLNNETILSQETLRGIAQAQSEYNCGIDYIVDKIKEKTLDCKKKRLLQVQIANERHKVNASNSSENVKRVEEIANEFVKNKSIIGVIGHPSSEHAAAAAQIYKDELVLISPDSTVVRKNNYINLNYDYLFRTSSTDYTAASDLINYIYDNSTRQDLKIAMIGDETPYSKSFRDVFKNVLENRNNTRETVNVCQVSSNSRICSDSNNQDISDFIKTEEDNKTDVILLALDFETSKIAARDFVNSLKSSKMKFLGSDGVYNLALINALKKTKINLRKEQMIIAVPWHRSKESENRSEFETKAEELWKSQINWRTAMAYDATQVITNVLENLRKNNDSDVTSKKLAKSLREGYLTTGAAGTSIKFCSNGDRALETGIGVLVEVVQEFDASEQQKSDFSLLKKPERENGCES